MLSGTFVSDCQALLWFYEIFHLPAGKARPFQAATGIAPATKGWKVCAIS